MKAFKLMYVALVLVVSHIFYVQSFKNMFIHRLEWFENFLDSSRKYFPFY
jgi:hypothetical protein